MHPAWAAEHRLFRTYRRLTARGRPPQVAATAVAREPLKSLSDGVL